MPVIPRLGWGRTTGGSPTWCSVQLSVRVVVMLVVFVVGLFTGTLSAYAAPPPWYPPMRWYPASGQNYTVGRGGTPIEYIVIHGTDGRYVGALSWFRDPRSELGASRQTAGSRLPAITVRSRAPHSYVSSAEPRALHEPVFPCAREEIERYRAMVQCLAEERLKIGQRPEAARSVMGAYFERMSA